MATVETFEDLEAWKLARTLTRSIYAASSRGGFARDFGLRDQMRRASVSVVSNIAEGFESRTTGLFLELLGRARGSAGEVRAQLYVALDVGYLDQKSHDDLASIAIETSRCIIGLMKYLAAHK